MPTDTTMVMPSAPLFDEARLAIAGVLAKAVCAECPGPGGHQRLDFEP